MAGSKAGTKPGSGGAALNHAQQSKIAAMQRYYNTHRDNAEKPVALYQSNDSGAIFSTYIETRDTRDGSQSVYGLSSRGTLQGFTRNVLENAVKVQVF